VDLVGGCRDLRQDKGEVLIDQLGEIEDTKGNNGQTGRLLVTNLRLIWVSDRKTRTNLSVGYTAIASLSIKGADSKLRGKTRALYVLAKNGDTRFQFIFTNCVPDTPRLFTTIQAVHRAYETSKLYREVRLRSAVVDNNELLLLPHEEIYEEVDGVWNLSHEQGQLGKLLVTNVRIVWFAASNELFNISVPYYQMKSLSVKDTKFGKTMVVKTSKYSGAYTLGFRVDPPERAIKTMQRVNGLLSVYCIAPVFGVDFEQEEAPPELKDVTVDIREDDVEIIDQEDPGDVFAAYLAEAKTEEGAVVRPPVYNDVLGLAIEELRPGTTLKHLWEIL
jgi:Bardet-Biedl syndrome 5 protein